MISNFLLFETIILKAKIAAGRIVNVAWHSFPTVFLTIRSTIDIILIK